MNDKNEITLRDYFAAKAMQAIISNSSPMRDLTGNLEFIKVEGRLPHTIAELAYMYADAMLEKQEDDFNCC